MNHWHFDLAVTKIDGEQVTFTNKGQLVVAGVGRGEIRRRLGHSVSSSLSKPGSQRRIWFGWERSRLPRSR